ncbi:cytoskeleton-associated protein 2-like isoform X2 [Ascaphus truei]|uniref:cytoskeleton-associated protein 2-like isoform X2 n=1 Tax=Ascaphus truei TaxID=8439 RepID=UPI003F5969BA
MKAYYAIHYIETQANVFSTGILQNIQLSKIHFSASSEKSCKMSSSTIRPYLKDSTNRQSQKPCHSSKPTPVSKQKENVLPNDTRFDLRANQIRASSHFSVQQRGKTAPTKLPARAVSTPGTVKLSTGTSRLKHCEIGTSEDQQKDAALTKTHAAEEPTQGEAAVCNFSTTASVADSKELKSEEASGRGLVQSEIASQNQECSVSVECVQGDNLIFGVTEQSSTVPGIMKSVQSKTKLNHPTLGRMTATLRNPSRSLTIRMQNHKDHPKMCPSALKTQRPVCKCNPPQLHTGQTCMVSRAGQPAPSQSRINTGKPSLVKTCRTENSHPKGPQNLQRSQNAGIVQVRASTLKTNNVNKPSADLRPSTVICKNRGLRQRSCVVSKVKPITSINTAPKQQSSGTATYSKPASRPQSMGNVASSKAVDRQRFILSSKPGPRHQSTGSAVCTKPGYRHCARSDIASNKPGLRPTREGTVSSNKPIKPSESRRALAINKVSDTARSAAFTKQSYLGNSDDTSQLPTTPRTAAEERKKKLEEWMNSKGKTYKRPPMSLPSKQPAKGRQLKHNCSLWEGMEEEEELLGLVKKMNTTLSECLQLIDQGVPSESIHAVLSTLPEAEKFATFWVCKARLLERDGTFDVVGLYEQAVRAGASPIEELRDVIFDLLKNTTKKTKAVTFGPLPNENYALESKHFEDEAAECPSSPSHPTRKTWQDVGMPSTALTNICEQGSAFKLQVGSVFSKKREPGTQDWKLLTPVRRSLRIERAMSRYPEVLKEHDTVVASLEDLLGVADTDGGYLYYRNEALPEEVDQEILDMVNYNSSIGEDKV